MKYVTHLRNLLGALLLTLILWFLATDTLTAQFKGGSGRGDAQGQLWQAYGTKDKKWLKPNFPNPFSRYTILPIKVLDTSSNVVVKVYDLKGSLIAEILNQSLGEGEQHIIVDFQALQIANGLYLCEVQVNGRKEVAKLMYMN